MNRVAWKAICFFSILIYSQVCILIHPIQLPKSKDLELVLSIIVMT